MAGIAAALSGAARILDDGQCRKAAEAALAFEHGIYSEKLGTWPDLRSSPVVSKAMHGLCSGAPGIGQALLCCRRNGLCSPQLDEDLERARSCCIGREPLFRDHLCCGNLSAVDFLLTLPDCRQHAGRLLAFMKRRKDAEGGYRYLPAAFRQVACPDLLYGAAGMGYELIRYAYPSMLHQILF